MTVDVPPGGIAEGHEAPGHLSSRRQDQTAQAERLRARARADPGADDPGARAGALAPERPAARPRAAPTAASACTRSARRLARSPPAKPPVKDEGSDEQKDSKAAQRRRHPDVEQPRLHRRPARPLDRARRPELHHPEVPRAALPPADLPGRRDPVRHPLGGPGGDQRDRDRLRPQPERLLRRRGRLDAVHALHLEDVRRRRQQGRAQGPVQPGRRDLRRRALPQGRRLRGGRARARSSPTTTPTGTSTRSSCARV